MVEGVFDMSSFLHAVSADRHSACATHGNGMIFEVRIGVCFTLGANIGGNVTVKTRIVNSISLEIFIFGTTKGDTIDCGWCRHYSGGK